MKDTEEKVKVWLQEFSLVPERYTKEEMRAGLKTSDFKVYKGQQLQFFCEVKAVVDKGDTENDTIPNQLTDDIHDAFKKFKDVNVCHAVPNVLAFVNRKITAGVDYLEDVLTGHWYMDNGNVYPFYVYYSDGRIKNEKSEIDLYLWLEDGDKVKFRFTDASSTHFDHLCQLFGITPSKVKNINAKSRPFHLTQPLTLPLR
jgi:hypothetical protein